ncbi:hypothetical protein ACFL0I_00115 [Gemmatimonadota bacterium]
MKAVYPIDRITLSQVFLDFSWDGSHIGLDVRDSYLRRRPAWMRLLSNRSGHLLLSSQNLKGNRDEILRVLQERLEQYELRSVSEAKQLESGIEN